MRKKLKLLVSLSTFCIAIAVLCFGVFAAIKVTYTVSGTISYDVNDAWVEVNTKVYYSPEFTTGPDMLDKVYELGDADFNDNASFEGLTPETTLPAYSSQIEDSYHYDELDLKLGEGKKTFYIVINVKNLSSDVNVWAVVNDELTTPENILQRNNGIQQYIQDTDANSDNKNIVIGLSVENPAQPVTVTQGELNLDLGIQIGVGEYSLTEQNQSKMTFDLNEETDQEDDYMVSGLASGLESGVLVIPQNYVDGDNLYDVTFINWDQSIDNAEGNIETIVINDNITQLEWSTFFEFNELKSIILPSSLTSISSQFIEGSEKIEHIYMEANELYTTEYNGEQVDCLIEIEGNKILQASNGTKFEYLDGIEFISQGSFSYLMLESVQIPDSVTTIEEDSFFACLNLTTITISDSAHIEINSVFSECDNLTTVVFSEGTTYIWDGAIKDFESLITVQIPTTVETIRMDSFNNCINLKNINISTPSRLTYIDQGSFIGCTSLESITIPNSVTIIGSSAFADCYNLLNIFVEEDNESYTSRDNSGVEKNCIIDKVTKSLILGCANTQIPSDGSVTIIENAFSGQSNLKEIEIPNTITSFIGGAFSETGLTEVQIPSSVLNVGYNSFAGCSNLEQVIMSNGVKTIDSSAFENCINLTTIEIPSSVTNIGSKAFKDTKWLNNLVETNGLKITESSDDSNVKFLISATNSSLPSDGIITADMLTGVKIISDSAFSSCKNLKEINIPSSVTNIGNSAFYGCNITTLTIPSSVTSIGSNSFSNCNNLTDLTILSSKIDIGSNAFSNCQLTNITCNIQGTDYSLVNGKLTVNKIRGDTTGENTHYTEWYNDGINQLVTSIEFSEDCTRIIADAFKGCIVTSITIPENIAYIAPRAFEACKNLESVTFDHSPEEEMTLEIDSDVFKNFKSGAKGYIQEGYTWTSDKGDIITSEITDLSILNNKTWTITKNS